MTSQSEEEKDSTDPYPKQYKPPISNLDLLPHMALLMIPSWGLMFVLWREDFVFADSGQRSVLGWACFAVFIAWNIFACRMINKWQKGE